MEGDAGDLVRDGGVRSMTSCEPTGADALLYQSAGELSLDEAYGVGSTEERALQYVGAWLGLVGSSCGWSRQGSGLGPEV